ncbi:TonB-dependent receptor [Sphingomonas sp. So64.6b]|uniref:TonB-dependent receptor n=1 Tax=Sphingomonas sp. So64.6b TaxID=2997354 RepID=UPI001602D6A1|nr:TonB-dependent receptor [Sphingomonas sp. So64.6b]QNA83172.1 TonB-dependent receptor [Sphingomonas sp. So64.6b]
MSNWKSIKLAALFAATAPISLLAASPAHAQEKTYTFNIPRQSLGSALRQFSQTTNLQVIFLEKSVAGKPHVSLVGRYSAADALHKLLLGTGLPVRQTPAGMYVLGENAVVGEAAGQTDPNVGETEEADAQPGGTDIVVTGSRIRKAATDTSAPVTVVRGQDLTDRGYVTAGQMLNDITSNVPDLPITISQGFPSGPGQTYPNLFNLGAGRTLTLVNGRRMVASASGLGDRAVDTNVIPAGLIDRIDIVQAGGAAVYGSDAIAGVVNYVLKKDFQGLEIDLQNSISTFGDDWRPYVRLTAGQNFAEGRGNIAVNMEYSKTEPLTEFDRPWTDQAPFLVTNPLDTGPNDGIPNRIYITNARYRLYNRNGVLYQPSPNPPFFSSSNINNQNRYYQFSADGSQVIPFNRGAFTGGDATASGGDGADWREVSSLGTGVERYTGTVTGHFDITSGVRAIGEFVYGREKGTDPYGTQSIFRAFFNDYESGSGLIPFNRTNPFLTPAAIARLDAISPIFASGGDLLLSRFMDILPSRNRPSQRDTWRALVGLEGDFQAADRSFYWSLTASRGQTTGFAEVWAPYGTHLNNALAAVRNGAGQIVCSINADADQTNNDAACIPFSPFGDVRPSDAALAYVTVLSGERYKNVQDDYLATFGGDLLSLPGGKAKFSLAYEHRRETARLTPYEADQLGLTFNCCASVPTGGGFNTDEVSAELLVPIIGEDFTLPGVKALVADGSFRYVDNSIAGKAKVWGAGLRWDTGFGVTFRGSRSRNFRAPSLDQLFAPVSTSPFPIGRDPCDADNITSGPDTATRLRNCQALFAANPDYGPLAAFQDPAEDTSLAMVATGGNKDLKNEISNTLSYGVVFQPDFIPGLTFTADRIEVHLQDGLTAFSPANFLSVCFDSTNYPNDACNQFTRNAQGYVVAAKQTTFNAAIVKYHGEVYNLNYVLPLDRIFSSDLGKLEFNVEATHTSLALTDTTGFNATESQGTVQNPDWRGRLDVNYTKGPLKLFYQLYYLPAQLHAVGATIENDPIPVVSANYRHTISVQYELPKLTLRAGVNNFTNEGPSFPTRSYGDIYGRQFFVGAKMRFR